VSCPRENARVVLTVGDRVAADAGRVAMTVDVNNPRARFRRKRWKRVPSLAISMATVFSRSAAPNQAKGVVDRDRDSRRKGGAVAARASSKSAAAPPTWR